MLTSVEISTSAINHNLKEFRKIIGPDRLLMPVIKSNAYGHGLELVAKLCDRTREVDQICVVNLEEALQLLDLGIKKPLLILGIYEHDTKKVLAAIKKNVAFPLYTLEQAKFLNNLGKKAHKKVRAHLKVDTGTSRIGILPKNAAAFVGKIKKYSHLYLEGLWSHFSSSENDPITTKKQQQLFEKIEQELEKQGIHIPVKHLGCSASALLYPSNCNAARFGISLYGLYPDPSTAKAARLKPALSWRTKVIQVKTISKGSRISYGGTFTTKKETKLAVLPVGYWDGLPRSASNRAEVLIKGKRCPIRGRICMNLCMVDVTGISSIKAGDQVTIIGRDGRNEITAEELANHAGTINYEIVTRINPLLPRITT